MCVYVCIYVYIHTYVGAVFPQSSVITLHYDRLVCMHACMCVYIYSVCVFVCVYVCVYIYIHMRCVPQSSVDNTVLKQAGILYACVCVCVYIYIYIYIW
jgi:hypothetical protein